ncbi:hypothetical protein ASG88_04520 [Nocardioides sp. Soil777]|nr:hypothetical protein ASG88_04520 [Nocardioides sp. Soil777]
MRGLGVDVVIESDDATIAARVRDAWRDAVCAPSGAVHRTVTVSFDQGADVHSAEMNEILHHLSPAVTREAIDARAGELVMLHAAALADPITGATAVLVAPSGTGKTTAAITLGRNFAYLTDETAGITEDGVVLAYRKPLSVIESGQYKTQLAPSRLGLNTSAHSGRLAALYLLERDPAHNGPPRMVPLDMIDALAELAPQVSFLGRLEHPLQRLADVLRRAGGAQRVTYREAADLEAVLARALDGTPR